MASQNDSENFENIEADEVPQVPMMQVGTHNEKSCSADELANPMETNANILERANEAQSIDARRRLLLSSGGRADSATTEDKTQSPQVLMTRSVKETALSPNNELSVATTNSVQQTPVASQNSVVSPALPENNTTNRLVLQKRRVHNY